MGIHVDICYTSASCNRTANSTDWGKNGQVCYGFSHAIAIYRPQCQDPPENCSIFQTLTGHTGKVNCVKWVLCNGEDEKEIVSGSSDKTAIVWHVGTDNLEPVILEGHEGPVTCVTGLRLSCNSFDTATSCARKILVVSTSTDATVRVWLVTDSSAEQTQVISMGVGLALSLSIVTVPGTNIPMMACGQDDRKIHLYTLTDKKQFQEVIKLSGHQDWIRGLDFAVHDSGDILLASCAQDQLIRVWRLVCKDQNQIDKSTYSSIADLPLSEDITMKETTLHFENKEKTVTYAVSLESVLCGHDGWVYSIRWQPDQIKDGKRHQPMRLLSASMDKTMILWEPDTDSGIWIDRVRVGDVGGNTLGFYGGLLSPCGKSILGHGYQGAFHQWTHNALTDVWEPQVTGGGHFDSVEDLAWSIDGNFLLTCSKDQTTRLHAPWRGLDQMKTWCEIARPQVHGYDLQCLAMLGKYKFASGADEKIVRLFSAPRNFITNFCNICGHNVEQELSSNKDTKFPEGANVPALGLSNKAVYVEDGGKQEEVMMLKHGQYPENYFTALALSAPPSEDNLLQNTLWPEDGKLYGHGYEIYSLAAHPNGRILASACKAASADAANILLWDMDTKKMCASLVGPSLTITQMAFSPSGRFLLAVSRDRTWTVFSHSQDGYYVRHAGVDQKTSSHSRIIWACCWTFDEQFFFTASRDKKVCAWQVQGLSADKPTPVSIHTLSIPVMAVSAAPITVEGNRYCLALGLESGLILIQLWSPGTKWDLISTIHHSLGHHLHVTRLAFRPVIGATGSQDLDDKKFQLASCGADHTVRVYNILFS